jgi:hypothetical protein
MRINGALTLRTRVGGFSGPGKGPLGDLERTQQEIAADYAKAMIAGREFPRLMSSSMARFTGWRRIAWGWLRLTVPFMTAICRTPFGFPARPTLRTACAGHAMMSSLLFSGRLSIRKGMSRPMLQMGEHC